MFKWLRSRRDPAEEEYESHEEAAFKGNWLGETRAKTDKL
jgi:hypothetical protein